MPKDSDLSKYTDFNLNYTPKYSHQPKNPLNIQRYSKRFSHPIGLRVHGKRVNNSQLVSRSHANNNFLQPPNIQAIDHKMQRVNRIPEIFSPVAIKPHLRSPKARNSLPITPKPNKYPLKNQGIKFEFTPSVSVDYSLQESNAPNFE